MNEPPARSQSQANLLRHLRAIALLPVMVALVIPGVLVLVTDTVNVGWGLPVGLRPLPRVLAGALIGVGLVLFGWTVALFVGVGEGTLAPWDETRRLVVRGVYRHVRNPMITGVLCVLLGEASLVGSLPLLGWFALFLLGNALYIPLADERRLERRFGEEYLLYKQSVPRWIPRLRPWSPPPNAGSQ
jgi:protein-S-isoprenylcysteine O-methyltransferase Ste14